MALSRVTPGLHQNLNGHLNFKIFPQDPKPLVKREYSPRVPYHPPVCSNSFAEKKLDLFLSRNLRSVLKDENQITSVHGQ